VNITLNGTPEKVPEGTSLEGLLTERGHDARRKGMAIARNGEVVPRGQWTYEQLADGDTVELLTASQGG
jgi:sulfur carrier protein